MAATETVSMAIRTAINILMSVVVMLLISWSLTFWMLATTPVFSLLVMAVSRWSAKVGGEYQKEVSKLAGLATDTFSNMRTVTAFRFGPGFMRKRWLEGMDGMYRVSKLKCLLNAVSSAAYFYAFWVCFGIILHQAAHLCLEGHLSRGELIAFLLYTMNLSTSVLVLGGQIPALAGAVGAGKKVFELLDRESEIREGNCCPQTCTGSLEMCAVVFSYPSRDEVRVLKSVSFSMDPCVMTAIVGRSGSGKSSCLALLQRLYDPSEGVVKIDGLDIRGLRLAFLRAHIATVSQEPVLFATTCKANIIFGVEAGCSEELAQSRMVEAAKLANCHDFILGFPEKYLTKVGERGLKLSGGQKQRVAIARAIVVKPSILLLDEATSALDGESEAIVQDALNTLFEMKAHTSIVVAHRLSTIKNAAKIVVMEDGMVQEEGTHIELLGRQGPYSELIHRQLDVAAPRASRLDTESGDK